jgi:hypothetical protein
MLKVCPLEGGKKTSKTVLKQHTKQYFRKVLLDPRFPRQWFSNTRATPNSISGRSF